MMNKKSLDFKDYVLLIGIAILLYWSASNYLVIINMFKHLSKIIFPFLLGGIIAFIINVPMRKIERFIKDKFHFKRKSLLRGTSITFSLLLAVIVLVVVLFLLLPELIENIKSLLQSIPGLLKNLEIFMLDVSSKYPDIQKQIQDLFMDSGNIGSIISQALNYILNGAVKFISNFVSGCVTFFTALIFAIYLLSQKEYVCISIKKVLYAFFSKKRAKRFIEIGKLANSTFSNFISGQCLEAIILGSIVFVVSLILRFPYAIIIAVFTTITALIPIFGAIIANVLGTILIALVNPLQALVFVVVFLLIQQIENNFIYPKVVGKSVGLSPMWTLFAITVGGALFGVVGMLFGLPLASVLYALFRDAVNDRLKSRLIVIKE